MTVSRFAFSIPTNSDEEQRQLFTGFRACGYGALQLKSGQYARYLAEPERFRADWSTESGSVNALIFGGGLDERGQGALRQVIAFARSIGSERVVFCHGLSRAGITPGDLHSFARILSELGKEAIQGGVKLSLHHHFDQPVMHPDDFRAFFDAVVPGMVGLTLDTAHLWKSGITDIVGMVRDYRSVLDNVHIKDIVGTGASARFVPLGEGEIPFAPVFTALRDNYTGWLCADEESGVGVQEGMQAAYRFLEQSKGE